jgi:hypothetical protein
MDFFSLLHCFDRGELNAFAFESGKCGAIENNLVLPWFEVNDLISSQLFSAPLFQSFWIIDADSKTLVQ